MQYHTKILLTSLITLIALHISAQSVKNITERLDWYSNEILVSPNQDKLLTVWSIDQGQANIKHPQLPRYNYRWALDTESDISVEIITKSASSITLNDDKTIEYIKANYDIQTHVTQERNQFYGSLSFIPVRKNGSSYEKLDAFKIVINETPKNNNTAYRTPPNTEVSVLATGDIYKFKISETGVHKLSYSLIKDALDENIDDIDPRNISIYGNQGGRLPQAIIEDRADDLQEIPIMISGESDGSFDNQDFILIYAESADRWSYDLESPKYTFDKNIYANENYIYLKVNTSAGKRLATQTALNVQAEYNTDSYDHLMRHEEDRVNLLGQYASTQGSGQLWFGSSFNIERDQDFSDFFKADNVVAGSDASLEISFAGRSSVNSSYRVQVDGNTFSRSLSRVDVDEIENRYASNLKINENIIISGNNPSVSVSYPQVGATSEGWLDYIQLLLRRKLVLSNNQLIFSDANSLSANNTEYVINTTPSDIQVWDVTDMHSVRKMDISQQGVTARIKDNKTDQLGRYLAFANNGDFMTPVFESKVANQNIHGITDADMIIVYYKEFEDAAVKLAEFRSNHDNIKVEAIEVTSIYNEFSSGRVDPTAIRDLSKMVYNRNPNYRYLLLFGDGSYDYKGLTPGLPFGSLVPVYESKVSLDPIDAFPTDDYFALLSTQDGGNLVGELEIAVGRIPAKTLNEANIVVNKIINYQTSPSSLGDWRMRNQFTSDDEDSNLHYRQSERISKKLEDKHPYVNIQKVHFDSYVQESTPGGERYTEATNAIINNVENGLLILNYLGHGGARGWAQERVLSVNDILNMDNPDKLALFVTATCSFTGYDDPALVSAGEVAMLSPAGAAIGLMTTVRSVYANENERLTQSVFDTIYTRDNAKYLTIGEAITRGKNSQAADTLSVNARKFALIGDPSMRLALPDYDIAVTTINNAPIGTTIDTIRALQKVEIEGIITDFNGQIIDDFNGTLSPTVFDKKSKITTLANDDRSIVSTFDVYKNVIFKGNASVTNGKWKFSFIVPKDIDYTFGNGKISLYASDGVSKDAAGYNDQIIIGGTSPEALADDQGPEIELFMDNESFVSGESTGKNPTLIVKLSDDNGINISGTSIGHDLTAELDEDSQNNFVLNEYYEANLDDYTGGIVNFPFEDLELGNHQVRVRAFDVANNSSEAMLDFVVVDATNGGLDHVLNYPNPFTTKTNFQFEHDFPNSSVSVLINIYTISGKLVKTIQTDALSKGTLVNDVEWTGKDDFGNQLAKGIYLYKIKIEDNNTSEFRESEIEKLVILK